MVQSQANQDKKDVIIHIRGLVNGFGNKVIHDHLDLDVYRGEVLGVVGGSGSGKSVLLRTIIGLNKPREGTIEVFGKHTGFAEGHRMRALEMRWGVLFQEGALFSSQTVAENIQVPLREYTSMSQELMDEIAAMKIAHGGLAARHGGQISLRTFRRHEEARGPGPRPGAGSRASVSGRAHLGPRSHFRQPVRRADRRTAESLGLTVFMVTHDLDTLRAVTDRIAVLVDKKIKIGTIEELRKDTTPWIHEYFSGPRGRAALAGSR